MFNRGVCGYGDLYSTGYGINTVTFSSAVFDRGLACRACCEVKCAGSEKDCHSNTSPIQVKVINFCLAGQIWRMVWSAATHFNMFVRAFQQIATYKVGNVPIIYRRNLVIFERLL